MDTISGSERPLGSDSQTLGGYIGKLALISYTTYTAAVVCGTEHRWMAFLWYE